MRRDVECNSIPICFVIRLAELSEEALASLREKRPKLMLQGDQYCEAVDEDIDEE